MLDITLDELISILGNPTRTTGHQYYFRCPACAQSGNDTHGDNLLYNDNKGVLKCFACDDGAKETLRLINAHRKQNNVKVHTVKTSATTTHTTPTWWQFNIENLYQYMYEANEEMPSSVKKYLWQEFGIDEQTIEECVIGYDSAPSMVSIGSSVVFPMISLNHDFSLVGFELRSLAVRKKIRHTLDSPSCICVVWGKSTASRLLICEGFKDAYCAKQLLHKISRHYDEYMICTPAHGCKDILKNLSSLNLTQFECCFLMLDNDDAGNEATQQIIQAYPFFQDKRALFKDYKDVCDYWRSICYN